MIASRKLASSAVYLLALILSVSNVWRWNHIAAVWVAVTIVSLYLIDLLRSQSVFWIPGIMMLGLIASIIVPPMLPVETETHGWLIPASDSTPPNPCGTETPKSGGVVVILGRQAAATVNAPLPIDQSVGVLKLGNCQLLSMTRRAEGLTISASVFDPENGKLIARIINGEFHLVSNEISYPSRPDPSTLSVNDQYGKEVLYVRYVNANAVLVRGCFFCEGHSPLVVTDDPVEVDGWTIKNTCGIVSPFGETAFSF